MICPTVPSSMSDMFKRGHRKVFTLVTCGALLVSLIGCGSGGNDTAADNDDTPPEPTPLVLNGSPPEILYYDSPMNSVFTVAGGNGLYEYRYIQNSEGDGPEPDGFIENHVEMTIEPTLENNTFWLRAVPSLPEGETIDSIEPRALAYQIEVTDGTQALVRDFDFTLLKNRLSMSAEAELSITEGEVAVAEAETLMRLRSAGNLQVCEPADHPLTAYQLEGGEYVYPIALPIHLDAPVSRITTITYTVESDYDEGESEESETNRAIARPGVDFIAEEGQIVMQPGQSRCVAFINLLDDSLSEPSERLKLVINSITGAAIDVSGFPEEIVIAESE